MKPRFKKGEKVLDDIYNHEWTVIDIVKRDNSFTHKYLYLVERTIKIFFFKKTIRQWKVDIALNKFVK